MGYAGSDEFFKIFNAKMRYGLVYPRDRKHYKNDIKTVIEWREIWGVVKIIVTNGIYR